MPRTGVTYSRLAGHNNTRLPGREEIRKAAIHGIVFVSRDHPAFRIYEQAQPHPYRAASPTWMAQFSES